MYGSGAATGMLVTAVVHRPILKAPTMGRTVWSVAVAVTTTPGAVAHRIVATATRRAVTATMACGWPYEFATKLPLLGRNPFCLA